MSVGQKIKQKRKEKRLTQQELADILGVFRQTISNWERNKAIPAAENFNELTSFFKVSLSYFLGELTPTVIESEFNAAHALILVLVRRVAAIEMELTLYKIKQGIIPAKRAKISHKQRVADIFREATTAAPLLKDWPFPDRQ